MALKYLVVRSVLVQEAKNGMPEQTDTYAFTGSLGWAQVVFEPFAGHPMRQRVMYVDRGPSAAYGYQSRRNANNALKRLQRQEVFNGLRILAIFRTMSGDFIETAPKTEIMLPHGGGGEL